MIWHKDMSLVLNIIKPQQLIQNIQIIACMKKVIYKCYRYGLSFRVHFLKHCGVIVKLEQSEACSLMYIALINVHIPRQFLSLTMTYTTDIVLQRKIS